MHDIKLQFVAAKLVEEVARFLKNNDYRCLFGNFAQGKFGKLVKLRVYWLFLQIAISWKGWQ
ncbi:MAG: hypothetical protein KUG80_03515 [Gammaproteobacteria bacterium]|nr:hypothetical protein [Gammaproteobacteria bacterium]